MVFGETTQLMGSVSAPPTSDPWSWRPTSFSAGTSGVMVSMIFLSSSPQALFASSAVGRPWMGVISAVMAGSLRCVWL